MRNIEMKWETCKSQVELLWKIYQIGYTEIYLFGLVSLTLYIAQKKINISIQFSMKIATLKETKVRTQYEKRSCSNGGGSEILKLQ